MSTMYGGYGFDDTRGRVIGGDIGSVLMANNPWLRSGFNHQYDPNGNPIVNGVAVGAGWMPGGGGFDGTLASIFGSGPLGKLLDLQEKENATVRARNEKEYQEAKSGLLGVTGRAAADPLRQQSRNLAQILAGNPEAINDHIQQLIANKARTQLDAQAASQQDQMMGQLANEGKLTGSAMAQAQGRLGNANRAALSRMLSDLEVERATRRNADITAASDLAARRAGEDSNLDFGVKSTMLQNLAPWYPADYSGMAAILGMNPGGFNGQTNVRFGGGGINTHDPYGSINDLLGFTGFNRKGPPIPGQPGVQTPEYWNQQQGTNWNLGNQSGWSNIFGTGSPVAQPDVSQMVIARR